MTQFCTPGWQMFGERLFGASFNGLCGTVIVGPLVGISAYRNGHSILFITIFSVAVILLLLMFVFSVKILNRIVRPFPPSEIPTYYQQIERDYDIDIDESGQGKR